MKVTATELPGVLVLEPRVFRDDRGFFVESFNQRAFDEAVGRHVQFVQDNQSRSTKGVLRGLHFQRPPHMQGKLVRVTSGAIFDVAVDLRRHSRTFGRWTGIELSDTNGRQLWIPEGFAHGFVVMSATADVQYKTTDYYAPASEGSVRYDDPTIAIEWPSVGTEFILSPKDAAAGTFESAPALD